MQDLWGFQERLAEPAPLGEGLPRVSVISYLGDKNRRPNIHFTGHYDGVPEGTGWTTDFYGCEIRNGSIYARGSAEQKTGSYPSSSPPDPAPQGGGRYQQ